MSKTILHYLHKQYHLQVPENMWARVGLMILMLLLMIFDFFAWIGGIIVGTVFVMALFTGNAHFSMSKNDKSPTSEIAVTAPHHIHSD